MLVFDVTSNSGLFTPVCMFNCINRVHWRETPVMPARDLVELSEDLVYVSDMACAHSVYCSNRIGHFFDRCQFMLDRFHYGEYRDLH